MQDVIGGVGSAVGRIAKILGCRGIGSAGGEARRRPCLAPFGCDAAIDHEVPGFAKAAAAANAEGIGAGLDNTAGAFGGLYRGWNLGKPMILFC